MPTIAKLSETLGLTDRQLQISYQRAFPICLLIRDINLEKNKILPEYYDFPEEEIKWVKIYEKPPYGTKSHKSKKQLMVRPKYPVIYHKNEMPAVSSISEVCVIIDGEWKVGNLVDWHEDDCYWSATVTKILTHDKVQIELPKCPEGQGKSYKAFCKDLRPSLDWSPRKGWTLPTVKGRTSCSARLIFPSRQDENASSTSRISVNSSADPMEEEPSQSQQVKIDGDDVEKASASDSISTMHEVESKTNDDTWENVDSSIIDLNIKHEETLEASILDLEELANRIKWLRGILENNQLGSGSWKFAEQR
ncbi:hypothetical protein LXL04_003304 [Taraxacum kok-saghyz]